MTLKNPTFEDFSVSTQYKKCHFIDLIPNIIANDRKLLT